MKRLLIALALTAASAAALRGQALEVMESAGFVEVNLPSTGWRQAVIGRQIPAGSVLTSWLSASARLEYKGSALKTGPFSHVAVAALEEGLVKLSLVCGSVVIEAPGPVVYEVEIRGMTVRVEAGSAEVSAESVVSRGGAVSVSGTGSGAIAVAEGASVALSTSPRGPVF